MNARPPSPLLLASLLLSACSSAPSTSVPLAPSPDGPLPLTHAVDAYAAWSPDGTRLVYQSSAAGNFELYEIRSDGSAPRLLEASPADDITPAFSPDGARLLFVSEREGNREIYVMPSTGGAAVNLSHDAGSDIHPAWSADGTRILFSSNRTKLHDDDFDIFEMRADGSEVRQVTRGPEVDTYASWSPDGRRIAYAGGGPDTGNKYLFLVEPDGANRKQLTFASGDGAFRYDTQPAFSPNGKWIAFTRYAPPMPFERAGVFVMRVPVG